MAGHFVVATHNLLSLRDLCCCLRFVCSSYPFIVRVQGSPCSVVQHVAACSPVRFIFHWHPTLGGDVDAAFVVSVSVSVTMYTQA